MRRDRYRCRGCAKRSFRGILILLSVFLFIVSGCAKKGGEVHKKLPPDVKRGDVMRPISVPPPAEGAPTPERRASIRLVARGKAYLDSDKLDLARTNFRDAINVDTTNGVAYYFLALTYYYLNRPDLAKGLLDKSSQLITSDEKWQKKIDELRVELGDAPKKQEQKYQNIYEESF